MILYPNVIQSYWDQTDLSEYQDYLMLMSFYLKMIPFLFRSYANVFVVLA